MKVLLINNVFCSGSTGKIVNDINQVLKGQGIESVVCYGRGNSGLAGKAVYKFCTEMQANIHHASVKFLGQLMYGGNKVSTMRLIKLIQKERPDVVHVHCINDYCVNIYELLRFLGEHHIKTLITNHSEFFFTGNCGYAIDCNKWLNNPGCGNCINYKYTTGSLFRDNSRQAWIRMRDAFASFSTKDLIISSVSPWTMSRSMQSPITRKFQHVSIGNGVNTCIFHNKGNDNIIREKIGPEFKHIVFYSSASFTVSTNSIKGGRFVVEMAKKMPEVLFVVAAINSKIPEGLPNNIFLWGKASTQEELASLYSSADVTLLTSKRETFSMVTAESLCCGTPVVGFLAGGPESITIPEYSRFVEYGDCEALYQSITNVISNKYNKEQISSIAIKKYSKETMTAEYIKIYDKLLKG